MAAGAGGALVQALKRHPDNAGMAYQACWALRVLARGSFPRKEALAAEGAREAVTRALRIAPYWTLGGWDSWK